VHRFIGYLVTTVHKTSNKQNTGQLGSGKKVGRDSTPETEEAVHTQVGYNKNYEESKELK
jgi:hypothetical protein